MINKINKLPEREFAKVFANIFENASWIANKLYGLKPFASFEDLSSKMINIFESCSKEKKLEILSSFRQRVSCDINIEFEEAKKQVKKIASLRLNEIKKNEKNIF